MSHPPGPCAWPMAPHCEQIPAEADRDTAQQAMYDRLLAVATETVWRASGRRYGVCSATVRPVLPGGGGSCSEGYGAVAGWVPTLDAGVWRNRPPGLRTVYAPLPGYVQAVTEVRIDGAVLPPSAYRVDDHLWLVRQDGGVWPAGQDLARPLGSPGTWSVAYSYGLKVGAMGQYALAQYLCELWKASTGGRCRLPARVEGIFRQGVNIDFSDDNLDLLSKGRTGIPETDAWLALVNPSGTTGPSVVYSPDLPFVRSVSWSTP